MKAVDDAVSRSKALWQSLIPHLSGDPTETRRQRIIRRLRIAVVIVACLVTLQSVLLVLGAWRDDHQIESNMGVAAAEVLDAGPRRSTIEFVTPDRITYRPELGVLYPSELDTGMRIYVEYDRDDPDLVRVQDRNASLSIIPAASIAIRGWLVARQRWVHWRSCSADWIVRTPSVLSASRCRRRRPSCRP